MAGRNCATGELGQFVNSKGFAGQRKHNFCLVIFFCSVQVVQREPWKETAFSPFIGMSDELQCTLAYCGLLCTWLCYEMQLQCSQNSSGMLYLLWLFFFFWHFAQAGSKIGVTDAELSSHKEVLFLKSFFLKIIYGCMCSCVPKVVLQLFMIWVV